MFISNTEKYQIQKTIKTLLATVSDLSRENEAMKQSIIELEQKAKSFKKPIVRTPEAPWGYKMNGTPRKRPGRIPPALKTSASAI